jgi:RHS repeat-associated protein
MPLPGRKYTSSSSYRYGFNEKENDKETVGTGEGTQDYGMRIYNPSLGKFLSVDPLNDEYPHYTPYQFAGNKPIRYIDVDGMEEGINQMWTDIGFYPEMDGQEALEDMWDGVKPTLIQGGKLILEGYAMLLLTAVPVAAFEEKALMAVESKALLAESKVASTVESKAVVAKTKTIAKVENEVTIQKSADAAAAGGCFIKGTLVLTSHGLKSIEKINANDTVWAYSDSMNMQRKQLVSETFTRQVEQLIFLKLGNVKLVTTMVIHFTSIISGLKLNIFIRAIVCCYFLGRN